MKHQFFNSVKSTTILAPIGLFFTFYARVFVQSYQEHLERMKMMEELKAKAGKLEGLQQANYALFPKITDQVQLDSPQCKK